MSNEELQRKRVHQFYQENSDKPKSFTVSHFEAENLSRSTIYGIIKRIEEDKPFKRQTGSGRKLKIMTKCAISQLTKLFDHKCGISQRIASKKFKCSQSLISKTLKTKTSIKKRKQMKIPSRTESQRAKNRRLCGQLYKNYKDFIWVLDDESYFTLSNSQINGNDNFYSSNIELIPNNVKFKEKKKFEEKLLVYVVILPFGLSTPYIVQSGTAINQHIYVDECFTKKLLPHIKQLPKNTKYIFWPDLASAHYSNKAVKFLNENGIKFVTKSENPPNMPECRCIEDFWSCIKRNVYKNGWQAENLDQLRSRIIYCFKKFDKELVQRLAESTSRRLDTIRRQGLVELR